MDLKDEKLITWAQARKILEAKEKDKEMGYEQKNAMEFLKKFSKLSEKKTSEMFEKLGEISKLKDRHKIMIINMQPSDLDEVRVLFAHEIINLSEDEKKKIISTVKKFA
jgi:DNA-directed RNA polymerase subunit F